MNTSDTERFLSKVDTSDADGCWTWTAGRNKDGYGKFAYFSEPRWRHVTAHRLAWEIEHGPIPNGLCVLHTCDNPPCVRVEHLFLGTMADNNADRVRKGRGADKHGERNGTTKMTTGDVLEIRARRASGETLIDIGRDFGLCTMQVSRIARRVQWSHI